MQNLIDGRTVGDGVRPKVIIDLVDGSVTHLNFRGITTPMDPKVATCVMACVAAIEGLATVDRRRRTKWNE